MKTPVRPLALLLVLVSSSPAAETTPDPAPRSVAAAPNTATRYPIRGSVVEVQTAQSTLVVKHEDIPGFMPAMTMPFRAPADILPVLAPGTAITARLYQAGDDWCLEHIRLPLAAGAMIVPEAPHALVLAPDAAAPGKFSGRYTFTAPATGLWRIEVSAPRVWVDVLSASGEKLPAVACMHALPADYAKGPAFRLTGAMRYAIILTGAPATELLLRAALAPEETKP